MKTLSADEAEEWVSRLQSAVRNAREGQGDQLLLLSEPARMVVTVQEHDLSPQETTLPPYPNQEQPQNAERVFVLAPGGMVLLTLLVILVYLMMRFRILPL